MSVASASRRSFLSLTAAASAAAALRIVTEPMLAQAAAPQRSTVLEGVMINANENPLGPCAAAREALIGIAPQGGRYLFWMADDFAH